MSNNTWPLHMPSHSLNSAFEVAKRLPHSIASDKNRCSWRGPARSSHAQFVQTRATRHHVAWPTSVATSTHTTTIHTIAPHAKSPVPSTTKNTADLRKGRRCLPHHGQCSWYHVPTLKHGDIPNWTYRYAARPSTPISLRRTSYRISDFTTESSLNLVRKL